MSVSYDANVIKLGKLWKGLGKFADKVLVNGEVIELGGNYAFESIEQLGTVGTVKVPVNSKLYKGHKYHVVITKVPEVYGSFIVRGKISNIVTDVTPYTYEMYDEAFGDNFNQGVSGPFPSIFVGKKLLPPSEYVPVTVLQGDAYNSFVGEFDIEVAEDIIPSIPTWDNDTITIYEDAFVPFFTEEQYQALLELIK